MSDPRGATARAAAFAAEVDLTTVPEAAVGAARHAIIDCVGVAHAAANEPIAAVMRTYLAGQGARPVATVMGLGLRTSPELAALAGGAMAHALDYDDVSDALYGHPSAVLVPAVLAAAEATGAPGKRVLEGYVAGFEVAAALGLGLNPHHYQLGWHATATLGSLGAAAGVARVLGLDQGATAHALGIAASMAGGLRRNFGSMTKPVHAGNAARAGVAAALMAQAGLTADETILEGQFGFAHLFNGSVPDALAASMATLGRRWSLAEDGIWFKQYPCCASTHRPLDALLALRQSHNVHPADVREMVCYVPDLVTRILIHPRPRTALEGKFSLQYCLAAALTDGQIGLGTFTDQQVERPEVRSLIERIRMEAAPRTDEMAELVITLTDGRKLSASVTDPVGHPRNPLQQSQLQQKFYDCVAINPNASAAAAWEVLSGLDSLTDAGALSAQM
jgi:2-methylcitrate dehydratase PrpD